jgi:hypothetical protein
MGEFGDVRYATLLDVGAQWEVAVKGTRRRIRRDSSDDCAISQYQNALVIDTFRNSLTYKKFLTS